jgi:hypothetical protein
MDFKKPKGAKVPNCHEAQQNFTAQGLPKYNEFF